MSSFALLVDRQDISQAALQDVVAPELQPGEARLETESLALSANTLTYAATGEALGYWKFFPIPGSAGLVPAWGIARVAHSRSPALAEGSRWFGFLPLASHLVVAPQMRKDGIFVDTAPHRRALPANYNIYRDISLDPHFLPGREEECALLKPLVMLSFLIVAQLRTRGVSASEEVMVTSASSKAALAAAFLAREAQCGRWRGLTSEKHESFVRETGAYKSVAAYEALDRIEASPRFLLDISGNSAMRARIEARWGKTIVDSQVIGATDWTASKGSFVQDGRTNFFFAPEVIKSSIAEWGAGAFEARFLEAWRQVLDWTPQWLSLDRRSGSLGLAGAYQDLLDGAVPPQNGLCVTF